MDIQGHPTDNANHTFHFNLSGELERLVIHFSILAYPDATTIQRTFGAIKGQFKQESEFYRFSPICYFVAPCLIGWTESYMVVFCTHNRLKDIPERVCIPGVGLETAVSNIGDFVKVHNCPVGY